MTWFETILVHFKDFFVFYLLGVVFMVWALINNRRKKKLMAKQSQKPMKVIEPPPQVPVAPAPEPRPANISDLFEDQPKEATPEQLNEDAQQQIERLVNVLEKNNFEIDKDMLGDLSSLKEYHKKVISTKEKIREYGLKLGRLFDKYKSREHQLNAMIIGMEALVEEPKDSKPTLQQPPNPSHNL